SLLNTPSAQGLFHKAMIMSGTLGEFMSDWNVDTTDVVEKWLEILEIDDDSIDELKTRDYKELCSAYLKANRELGYEGRPNFIPQRCEKYLGDPMHAGFSEFARKIPVVIGSTFSEFYSLPKGVNREMDEQSMIRVVKKEIGKESEKVIETFRRSFPDNPVIDVLTYDYAVFRPSVRQWVAERVREGCADTFMYLFKPEMKMNESCMPNHCADIPYFFHNTDIVDSSDIGEATKPLEREMFERFMAFARTGDVNNKEYSGWKACTQEKEYTYLFDEKCLLRENLDGELLELLGRLRKPFSFVLPAEEE
ncbi:MAG: carboxylesterase family protein, partial [Erysipelotrichaceae bacterium]|nr:carboxylesterase family protein [Erysipelotrichaceae bacterium]